ncbi:type I pullulanase [Alloscardovia omnicolens]|uniref:type I pullulanase n=1 Tax=Alloscardovia omnicolens TaxID=419015 RepID=UPI00254D9FA7|nr:type I pullulanase [Alloscardovia omnicolens]MDK8072971.1 type I pullulanase [Alloscardovia omnicolens]
MPAQETVVVHYHNANARYDDRSVWMWNDNEEGREYLLAGRDTFGKFCTIPVRSNITDIMHGYINILMRNADFSYKSREYRITLRNDEQPTHVWLVEGDDTVYYSGQAARTSRACALYDVHAFDMGIHADAFDALWAFDGWLGYSYTQASTQFRVWAPTAAHVDLFMFSNKTGTIVHCIIPMKRGDTTDMANHKRNTHGVWFATVDTDCDGMAYIFRVHHQDGRVVDSPDPYARAATRDGLRSVVLSPRSRRSHGFSVKHGDAAFWRVENPTEAVVCEMHIRDFTISHTSGVPRPLRGKYLGACESGTRNTYGASTGIDYIDRQGYSYVQLQPVAQFKKHFLPDGHRRYNWGYDPCNYNVPDPYYSTESKNTAAAIIELKTLIQQYHQRGIGVILDVVYNHTFSSVTHPFQLTVPDYFYRMDADGSCADGSGCGNETASEKEMVRKYIIDSVMYWAEEFNVDGFRFDLMGLHDIDTMNALRAQLDALDPHILMYGEGWDMGTNLAAEKKAKKDNAALMPRIGFFNDTVRDGVKGAEVYGYVKGGFVSHEGTEGIVAKGILGSSELVNYRSPRQVLNYIEAHDNYNLNDLLTRLHPDDDELCHIQRVEVANALNLVMQGMTFMQIGQEFLRTKLHATGDNGELTLGDRLNAMNSYNAQDEVNRVNWNQVTQYSDTVDFVRQLIALKTSSDVFSYQTFDEVRKHVYVWSAMDNSGVIGFDITDDDKKYRIVATTVDVPVHNVLKDVDGAQLIVSNNPIRIEKEKIIEAYTFAIFEQVLSDLPSQSTIHSSQE